MSATNEIKNGERFEFGKNWTRFLSILDDDRIEIAKKSLQDNLGMKSLDGLRFIDVSSGSGLFSLAARMLGAEVFSFDYDPQSVACTRELKRRYFENDDHWQICEGSVLDKDWLSSMRDSFDIVYSWGVLHHTGAMWEALGNVDILIKSGGKLFIAIYNDEGWKSRMWHRIKRLYCKSNKLVRWLLVGISGIYFCFYMFLVKLLTILDPKNWGQPKEKYRGMSLYYDLFDWIGGYPYEVATPKQIEDFYIKNGYKLEMILRPEHKFRNNQFIFVKESQ